jgi:(S)-2-hydroxyglutarate dehydrogenase
MPAADFLIVGAGVVGLTIACELKRRHPAASVTILEKEARAGLHSSGRNSGVLHTGIYYPLDSLKAKLCSAGASELAAYCAERNLPLNRIGKVLIPVAPADGPQLEVLATRAAANGIICEKLDDLQLAVLEPETRSATGAALWVPGTAVGDPPSVMTALVHDADRAGITLHYNAECVAFDARARAVTLQGGKRFAYHHLVNAAGLHADRVAHRLGVGAEYSLIPFKGLYWQLDPNCGLKIRHLIYPVPDLRVPFLGVHTTTSIAGHVYLGPTAVPAFGRENYRGLGGVSAGEALRISQLIVRQFIMGRDGFRRLAWQEGRRYFKRWFLAAAQGLLPRLRTEHLLCCSKVAIRAQLYDRVSGRLVNDFVVKGGDSSTHVLNAVSPAWTSAFPFARYVVENHVEHS